MERSDSMGMELTFQVGSWRNTIMKKEQGLNRAEHLLLVSYSVVTGLKTESATLVLIF